VIATSLYHSLIKPCFGDDERPFWRRRTVRVRRLHDVCTMWDIYKLALLTFLWVPFMIVRGVVGRGRRG
jgi:hypothetical protein